MIIIGSALFRFLSFKTMNTWQRTPLCVAVFRLCSPLLFISISRSLSLSISGLNPFQSANRTKTTTYVPFLTNLLANFVHVLLSLSRCMCVNELCTSLWTYINSTCTWTLCHSILHDLAWLGLAWLDSNGTECTSHKCCAKRMGVNH